MKERVVQALIIGVCILGAAVIMSDPCYRGADPDEHATVEP